MSRRRITFVRSAVGTAVLTLIAATSLAAGSPRVRTTSEEIDEPKPYRYWEDPYAGPYCGGPCGGSYCCNISVLAPHIQG